MIESLLSRFPREELDYQSLLDVLKDYARPRDKISDLIRKGVIVRVKKGLYVLGEDYSRRPYSKELLANLIYGPSYISLEWALQYHGVIPERVEAVTSVTTGRSKRFQTPAALFIYRQIPLQAFRFGMTRVENESQGAFLIATAEKALCDKIREDRGIPLRSLKEIQHYLLEDLRIDASVLANMNADHIADIAERYRSIKIRALKGFVDQLQRREKESSGE
jgi:hypothetical protein